MNLRNGAVGALAAALTMNAALAGQPPAETVELRGAWLWGADCADQAAADKMLHRAGLLRLNALFVLTFYHGATTCHRSDLADMDPRIAKGFDPLGYLVADGRKRGIEIHAWFVNGPIRRLKEARVLREHPDWQAIDLAGRKVDWYDLCNPAVRDWQAKLMVEVARRYGVRSVHFDYIRFDGGSIPGTPVARKLAAQAGIDVDALIQPSLPVCGSFHGNPLAEPTTARVLAAFDDGVPAIAVNGLGRGEVFLFNWHAQQATPLAVHRALDAVLRHLGAKPGAAVGILNSDHNATRYGRQPYERCAEWVASLGYRPQTVKDDQLAKLPAGAPVVLPNHYLMTDEQARALLAHVEAGGGAVFIDGPVFALRKGEAARKLLGFERPGRYFQAERTLQIVQDAGKGAELIPSGGPQRSLEAQRAAWRKWHQWRKDQVTLLVADVRRRVRAARKDCLVTAAVFRTKDAADHVAQDWPRWLAEGLVDYAIPMSYVQTPAELEQHFGWWKSFDAKLAAIIPAVGAFRIGKGKPPGQRARLIAEQIDVCRKQGAHGVVLFNLESLDDETAEALGRTAFAERAGPYAPGR